MAYQAIPPVSSSTGATTSWWQQREVRARALLNYAITQVDTPIPFDFSVVKPVLGGGAAPTVDTTKAGVVYKMNGATTSLGFVPDSNARLIGGAPKVGSWYVAVKASFASGVIDAQYAIPISLDNASTRTIYVALNNPDSTTKWQLKLQDGGAVTTVDLGTASATVTNPVSLGTALCPVGPPVTIECWFDSYYTPSDGGVPGRMQIAFQETIVATVYAYDGGLDNMPLATPLQFEAIANNVNLAMRMYGGFAMIKGSLL